MGFGIKTQLQSLITAQRRSPVVRGAYRISQWVQSAYHNGGTDFETNGEAALIARMAPADFKVVFDVGANIGEWSEHALRAWPKARVQAFEVAPQTADSLTENIRRAGLYDRIDIHRYGASNRAGTMRMYYYPENPELTGDTRRHPTFEAIPFEAEMVVLDDFADQAGITTIDMLKVDVEGAEHLVLEGLSKRLSNGTIRVVQFEHGPFATETKFLLRDVYKLLGDQYDIGKIYPDGVEFQPYSWEMEDFRFANFLCVSKRDGAIRRLVETR